MFKLTTYLGIYPWIDFLISVSLIKCTKPIKYNNMNKVLFKVKYIHIAFILFILLWAFF